MNLEIRSSLSISYRPDIDGLRSIAILSVIGFHLFPDLFPDLFPGGFIGVDLFFVLSGFLITKIINKKIKERTFSLKNFYARRIRRIFPCLIIVFLVFLLYGWLVLFPHEFKSLGGNIFFGSLSISNFYLYNEIGYFDMIGDKKPFLHTWSLSVEEQFYLLFPVFIVLLNKDKFLKKNTALILAFLIMLSLILMFFLMRKDINLAFYMPVTRFWEIMAGALLANLSLEDVLRKKKLSDFFSTVGIALILVPIFYFNAKQPYPGWRALVPTLGSFFLIASGCYSWVNEKILSHKIFVFVGLISYPLYLLHWPIISFIKIIDPNILSVTIKILILVFVFLLATIIYYFVERKIRNSEQHAKTLIGLMFLISVMSYLIYQQKISPFVSHKFKEVHHVSQAFGEWDYPDSNLEAFTFCERTLYRIGTAKETVLFFGDSNIEQYAPRIT
ncbi:MAG: acyltransferase, partial [Proteobacteria bacterium]|nr:acyltransferase [Pseudomonadota bacterium]